MKPLIVYSGFQSGLGISPSVTNEGDICQNSGLRLVPATTINLFARI